MRGIGGDCFRRIVSIAEAARSGGRYPCVDIADPVRPGGIGRLTTDEWGDGSADGAADEMELYCENGPILPLRSSTFDASSSVAVVASASPVTSFVKRPSSHPPIVSRLGLLSFPLIHEPPLSASDTPAMRSDNPFSCSMSVSLKYSEGRVTLAKMASQYLMKRRSAN